MSFLRGKVSAREDVSETSYDEVSRWRFGTGGGLFGFGAGGGGLQWVFGLFLVAVAFVAGKLVYLQVIQGPTYAAEAEDKRTSNQTIQAMRGTIYDRHGHVLAMSEECYDVCCNPTVVNKPKKTAALAAELLGGDAADYLDALGGNAAFAYLAHKADKEASEELISRLAEADCGGVYLERRIRRSYPYGSVCGQILGMVDDNGKGLTGLEMYYDEVLRGVDGEQITQTGNGGIPISDASVQVRPAKHGKDLVLSIDIDIQECVETQVAAAMEENEADAGLCMVTDPNTGEILAACSTPYADLTHPESFGNDALDLKLVCDSYDPGSIFKVLTAAIGIDSGTVQASTYYDVPPTILVGKDIVSDDDGRWEHEDMNLREILRRSSNVGAVLVAKRDIGADAFCEGVAKFGIGQATGIDFPGEEVGIVRTREQYDYDPSTLGSMSFGQGVTIPMVQMMRAIGSIANGGQLCTPHFATSVGGVSKDWPVTGRSVSYPCAIQVSDMMRTVVEEGTGYSAAVEGYDVAAKTGTGEQVEDGAYVEGKYLSSVIGFAPASSPEVLVYVGYLGTPFKSYSAAGPVFSAIMGEVLTDMHVLSTRGL